MTAAPITRIAVRLAIRGLVQGVGFRPYVHRLALRLDLAGWVRNTSGHVEVHVEGRAPDVEAFIESLGPDAPVLARLDHITRTDVPAEGFDAFSVAVSAAGREDRQPVSPDVATCDACLAELLDPQDRRHRYPFITCTDCGPRFTVIEQMPYDRERTSMRAFIQCPACLEEYSSPSNRRYHSETNSCPSCGPHLWLTNAEGVKSHDGDNAMGAAATMLRAGKILAIRGLGGFHLAVDATDAEAVERLRERKHREAKPLAVMVRTVAEARQYGAVGEAERRLLESPMRPIVLLRAHDRGTAMPLAPGVAPGLAHVGLVIAYTPLHHLLLETVDRPLVMTSGNRSEEPIATGNEEAFIRLREIADAFLVHDREIVARYDDSVVRVVDGAPVLMRRARGFAPMPVAVPVESPRPILAVGPHLKNTFTLLQDTSAWVSQHIGDLENVETVEHFHASRQRFQELFNISPEVVVHDLHPGYLSTRLAIESGLALAPPVQHHHAHVAAVMAEHMVTDPVIGVAYDGTGYGDDGAIWGAEILWADLVGYRRLAHLRYAPLPGGDAATRAPWRVAAGYLVDEPGAQAAMSMALEGVPDALVRLVRRQLERSINTPLASSMGRLFDAAAAILGVRTTFRFEGEAAMALEALAADHAGAVLPFGITMGADGMTLDPVPMLVALGKRRSDGAEVPALAASFHDTIVHATVQMVQRAAEATGCHVVALGGGCFQNARLLSGIRTRLERDGFMVLLPMALGPNDGAISYGQAAITAARLSGRRSMTETIPRFTTHGG